jgi:hypothetical protein
MTNPLLNDRQIAAVRNLLEADRRLGGILEPLCSGWRNGDGREMDPDDALGILRRSMMAVSVAIENVRREIGE